MNVQLTLIDSADAAASEWQIDDETKEIGLAGLRMAREALAEARTLLSEATEPVDTNVDGTELPAAA